jgi:hypothetical protein
MTTSVSDLPVAIERRNIGRGTPLFADEPRTLSELFVHAARKHDRIDALSYKRNGSGITFPQINFSNGSATSRSAFIRSD